MRMYRSGFIALAVLSIVLLAGTFGLTWAVVSSLQIAKVVIIYYVEKGLWVVKG